MWFVYLVLSPLSLLSLDRCVCDSDWCYFLCLFVWMLCLVVFGCLGYVGPVDVVYKFASLLCLMSFPYRSGSPPSLVRILVSCGCVV